MKVLFLEIDTVRDWAVASIGPAFLSATLKRAGHTAEMLRVSPEEALTDVVTAVTEVAPDVIGVSMTSRQWLRGREVLGAIRAELKVPVIAGGLHPTFAPEAVLQTPGFDVVCLGEGEGAMLDYVEHVSRGGDPYRADIENLWFEGQMRPKLRPPFDPIDRLPWMDRSLLDERWGVRHMTTQRGCPFPCTYCAARKFDDLYVGVGTYGRRRTVQSVIDELLAVKRDEDLSFVIFLDDTFTIHHSWVNAFCDRFKAEVGVGFSLHARVETVNQKMLARLAEAGCVHITYGVESGSERVRRDIMKRKVSNDRIVDVFRWTQELGIVATANYMLGVPGETWDDIQETLMLHERLKPDDFGYFVFYPYPGTTLFQVCKSQGLLPDDYLEHPANHRASILDLPDLSADQIAAAYDLFTAARRKLMQARHAGLSDAERAQIDAHIDHIAATG